MVKNDSRLDEVDYKIMGILQKNARISISKISQKVAMSQPSVKERISKLEEQKIILGYDAVFNPTKLEKGVTTFILCKTEKCQSFIEFCENSKEVSELHRISGEYNYLMKVQTASIEDLAHFQDLLIKFGNTKSLVSMKNNIKSRLMF
ncbi:Lrp/AsnC family transcriptional regulator [Niallia sp. 03133]|uniref:Lrp/AsnC family transcriptional regulator n=1 Tax=Niallia sp. 03133 TaxID=3458060 RepID=UPI004043CEED